MAKHRRWHFHPEPNHGNSMHVYRGAICTGRGITHPKYVGYVHRAGYRKWRAELFGHVADRETLVGKGRTRHEAVADAIASGGIPRE